MPRSGDEYIYNSRGTQLLISIGESFGSAFIWLMRFYGMADPGAVCCRSSRAGRGSTTRRQGVASTHVVYGGGNAVE
jgi:hypothetical protein